MLLVVIAMGVLGALFTIREWWWLYAVGIWIYMALVPAVEASEQTVIQKVVPFQTQGRVFGFAAALESAAAPITAFLIAPIAQFWIIPYMDSDAGQQTWGWLLGDGEARGIALVFLFSGLVDGRHRPARLHDPLLPDAVRGVREAPDAGRRRRSDGRRRTRRISGDAAARCRGARAPTLSAADRAPRHACAVARVGSCAPIHRAAVDPSPRRSSTSSAPTRSSPIRRARRVRARRRRVGGVPPAARRRAGRDDR